MRKSSADIPRQQLTRRRQSSRSHRVQLPARATHGKSDRAVLEERLLPSQRARLKVSCADVMRVTKQTHGATKAVTIPSCFFGRGLVLHICNVSEYFHICYNSCIGCLVRKSRGSRTGGRQQEGQSEEVVPWLFLLLLL
eukprot:scpid50721/ scgid19812/ 